MRVNTWIAFSLLIASVAAVGCGGRFAYNLPPAQQLVEPGPGVGGPGPGVIPPASPMTMNGPPAMYAPGGSPGGAFAAEQCQYCEEGGYLPGGGGGAATSQIAFVGQEGLLISWDVTGQQHFDSAPLAVPGRQDFSQGAIYRLRLSDIPGRPGVTLYPTLEVAPVTPRTDAYLAHAPVPVQFTEEDFDQVLSGNFVTKVVYLPDPEFQELALSGVETLVSTRLEPGVDPVSEADMRGSILAVLRIGSKDLGGPGSNDGIMPVGYGGDYDTSGEYMGPKAPPQGMPTAGMAPGPMPPHMIAGMGAQYGMPMTGTPIGLPGPPHIPLGSPAGLRKHTMTNRTRVNLPPPTNAMNVVVKQRPGMNYPRPVNKVRIDEVTRSPLLP